MCGRFVSTTPPEAIVRMVKAVNPVPNVAPSWNIAPSQQAMAVRRHPKTGERHLDLLTWGFVPHWADDLKTERKPINARAETVATSPMFRAAFAHNRCLVPANAYYEWQAAPDGKQPYAFARKDGAPMMLAGLWDVWQGAAGARLRSFTLITTSANEIARPIHDRMPVIVEAGDWPLWLGDDEGDPGALLRPAGDEILKAWPVSRRVNSPANNDAPLMDERW
ncbi:MAG TPA: SOS response-associated peptidase [Acidiphilium sp.]|nr:SOS response-associated peptidase [Acidiphilium sp.]HQU25277.1 SOS response-associated peptidase [Acidiphilium sp.]